MKTTLLATLLALLTLAAQGHAFPFWLESPSRSNPNDPQSDRYAAPRNTPMPSLNTFTPTRTGTPTVTVMAADTATSVDTPTFTGTATSLPTAVDTDTPTFTSVVTPDPTATSTLSPTQVTTHAETLVFGLNFDPTTGAITETATLRTFLPLISRQRQN